MSRVKYMPAALQALDDIYLYTLETWGQEQADTYLSGLFHFCEALHQGIKRPIPKEFGVDGYIARYQKHYVYWRMNTQSDTVVVHVLHEQMNQVGQLGTLDI